METEDYYINKNDGRRRKYKTNVCQECNSEFKNTRTRRFCSNSCATKSRFDHFTVVCAYCGVEITRSLSKFSRSKSGLFFCNKDCKCAAQRIGGISEIQPAHYGIGITSYRDKAFRFYGKICKRCGYSDKEEMLDVHHIDSDRDNPNIDNLAVLCVWCQGLITRKLIKFEDI
jgi:hypothetical protein